MDNGNRPKVSVIVPTYNNCRTIRDCISSIQKQDYIGEVELIVVDNESSDGTQDICRDYGIECISKRTSRTEARKIGAKRASGKYLFHIDSDMALQEDVIKECVSQCEGTSDAVIIPEKNIGDTYWAAVTGLEKKIFNCAEAGYLRFLSKDLYFQCGGHDVDLEAKEDLDLHIKAKREGASISFLSRAKIYHLVGSQSFWDVLGEKIRYAKSVPDFKEKNESPISPDDTLFPCIIRQCLLNPLVTPGFIIVQSISMIFRLFYEFNRD